MSARQNIKPLVASLTELAGIFEQNRNAVLEAVEQLSTSSDDRDEAVDEVMDLVSDLREEIEGAHTMTSDILTALHELRGEDEDRVEENEY